MNQSKKRAALERRATPRWANMRAIYAFYEEAYERRKAGEDVQVDHVIPLVNPLVCGLHCEANLQIVSARENSYKCNYYSEDTPLGQGRVEPQLSLF